MINSGLSLLRALTILSEQTENKTLAGILAEVRNESRPAVSLSSAMAKHPDVFPPLMVNMTRAGEIGGFLDAVLLQIAENYEAEVKLRGKIKSAMTYPVVVFVMAILATIGMLLFIVPVFEGMFDDLGGTLPAPTRILVFLSNMLKVGFPVSRRGVHRLHHHLGEGQAHRPGPQRGRPAEAQAPGVRQAVPEDRAGRFARNLGTMLRSGVPILQALDIVADTTGNVVLARAIRDVQESVRNGETITARWRTTRSSRRWSCR